MEMGVARGVRGVGGAGGAVLRSNGPADHDEKTDVKHKNVL